MTQVLEKPQAVATKNPLNSRDRRIIATIVNQSDYSHECQPEHVITIWINSDDVVWVKMTHGYARFNKEPFKAAVAHFKQSLPETQLERNERLHRELEQTCNKFGLIHGQIDWLSFSTKLFRGKDCVGSVGYNAEGWYARRRQYGPSQQALSASGAIALDFSELHEKTTRKIQVYCPSSLGLRFLSNAGSNNRN